MPVILRCTSPPLYPAVDVPMASFIRPPEDWKEDLDDLAQDAVGALQPSMAPLLKSVPLLTPFTWPQEDQMTVQGRGGVKYAYTVELRDQGYYGPPARHRSNIGKRNLRGAQGHCQLCQNTYEIMIMFIMILFCKKRCK